MKYGKMLGLAVVAALAIMAIAGASAASAKLCSSKTAGTHTPTTSCGVGDGNVYSGEVHAILENTTGTAEKHVVLTSGFITVTCTESTVQGTVNGTTTSGSITALTFGGHCVDSLGRTCTAETTASAATPWAAKAVKTNTSEGRMEVTAPTGKFVCGTGEGKTTCYYDAAVAGSGANELNIYGGPNKTALIEAKVALTKEAPSDAFCSSVSTWSGVYKVTTPDDLIFG